MPEFKVKCIYRGVRKGKFFKDKEPVDYHKFSLKNPEKLPRQYFSPQTRLGKGDFKGLLDPTVYCWIFISPNLVKKVGHDFKVDQDYQFIMKLGEPKTADFTIYYYVPPEGYKYEEHQMVLKTKEYWENTVQKIGFGDSENYFYEVKKPASQPPKSQKNHSSPAKKNDWGKITFICLTVVTIVLLAFLIIKLANITHKRKK